MLLVKVLFMKRACNVWYSPKNEEITLPHNFIIVFILILSILINSMICIVSYIHIIIPQLWTLPIVSKDKQKPREF